MKTNMIRPAKHGCIALLAALFAACDEPDEFYTVVYPVARVDAQVEIATAVDDDENPAEDPTAEAIRAEVLAAAPMEAGGSYTLRFTQYNGGTLETVLTAGAAPLPGAFLKTPGTTELQLVYDERLRTYEIDSYRLDDRTCAVLELDLTVEFQTRYPEAGIMQAVRREYTTAKY